MARSFVDTNVLVYTDDAADPVRQARALDVVEGLLTSGNGVVSTQVLQEYFVATTRKLGTPADVARRKVELFGTMDLVVLDLPTILGAIDLHRLHRLSFWDALVVEAAGRAGCRELLSEDLQAGRAIAGLLVIDPFA